MCWRLWWKRIFIFETLEIKGCYEICPDEYYKYNKTKECVLDCSKEDEDLKEGNGECINKTFNLNQINPTKLVN